MQDADFADAFARRSSRARGLPLFRLESWTGDPSRTLKVGIPEDMLQPRTGPEIAWEEIDRLMTTGLRFSVVLTDAGYGLSAAFRQELSARPDLGF
ncbi:MULTISPECIES: transposase [unclassified Rhizobium]|uniref:transposase n=1 Tax=unclassified Rhizobium TaxID=2613769 RepID=UPI00138F8069|nr:MULTISPECIES: transposase [unclassified Rhizobium]